MAIGQGKNGSITVATVALAHGADNVLLDKEDSSRTPLPHWGLSDVGINKEKKGRDLGQSAGSVAWYDFYHTQIKSTRQLLCSELLIIVCTAVLSEV